jgi:hypothetical protein
VEDPETRLATIPQVSSAGGCRGARAPCTNKLIHEFAGAHHPPPPPPWTRHSRAGPPSTTPPASRGGQTRGRRRGATCDDPAGIERWGVPGGSRPLHNQTASLTRPEREEAPRELWLAPPPSRGSSDHRWDDPLPGRPQPGQAKDLAILRSGRAAPTPKHRPLPSDRWTENGVPAQRPSLTLGRIGLASHPPPKRRLQTPPRTRSVNRLPDPPGHAVSSPSVVRMCRPRSSTLR